MARKEKQAPKTFLELLERGRQEMPPAADVRSSVRRALSLMPHSPSLSWVDVLVQLTAAPRIRTGFSIAFAALTMTATLELSRPAPVPQPPMPHFLIDRLFQE